jgi:hypothetical protein
MSIQKISRVDRIEIAIGTDESARGAFVTMVEGYWNDETSAWDVPPNFYQVPLSVDPQDGIDQTLITVLGQSYGDLAKTSADRQTQIVNLQAQVDDLQGQIAQLQTRVAPLRSSV